MRIYLIGTGMGGRKTLTAEAERACREAEVLIGAERMVNDLSDLNKPVFISYRYDEIRGFADSHAQYSCAAVLLSGDISFYSAAGKLREKLKGHEVVPIAGISSLSYMCAKLGIDLNDTEAVSLHGKKNSYICRVRDRKYTFLLLNDGGDIEKISEQLRCFDIDCIIHAGSRLGYEDERIISFRPGESIAQLGSPVCAVIENLSCADLTGRHIPDSEFIRGGVPMTKSAVRAVSIARLELGRESVVYDIGAGTGSVSIEASLRSHDIRVYAVEREIEAIELINKNILKFRADNIEIVAGEAPQALECLPPPTHVFIGGSGRKAFDIIDAVIKKNPKARIVMNAVTLNTCSEVLAVVKRLGLSLETVCVNAAESKKAGESLLMMAQNPVYIFTMEAKGNDK